MTLRLCVAARSDRGLVRRGNQDSVYAGMRLAAVADGMGGAAAGDVASSIVITALAPLGDQDPGPGVLDALRQAVELADQRLRAAVAVDPALDGMGSTLTGLLLSGTRLTVVHIGDSRAYLLRDGEFRQLTRDDTFVQMLVDDGHITAEAAQTHPQRFLVTKVLQGNSVPAEYTVREARPGDRFLVCSDGLSGVVEFDALWQTLKEYPDREACVDQLLDQALAGGAPDNVTAIVADIADVAPDTEDIPAPIIGGAAAVTGA